MANLWDRFAAWFTRETVAQRQVKRGAELLDDQSPGWYTLVDLDILDLGSSRKCVLGQVFGYFHIGKDSLNIKLAEPYGFVPETYLMPDTQRTIAWEEEVTKRLAAA
jgi:hypothetical protein